MFRHEIDSLFTKKVADYIAAGYIINSGTMSGNQGEIGKIDLRKDDTYIRIMLSTSDSWEDGNRINLTIGCNTDKIYSVNYRAMQNLKIIETQSFVQVSENWYVLPEKYPEIVEKRQERAFRRYDSKKQYNFNDKAKKIVLAYLRRQPNCKTVRFDEIQSVYKEISASRFSDTTSVSYRIRVRGKIYTLNKTEV